MLFPTSSFSKSYLANCGQQNSSHVQGLFTVLQRHLLFPKMHWRIVRCIMGKTNFAPNLPHRQYLILASLSCGICLCFGQHYIRLRFRTAAGVGWGDRLLEVSADAKGASHITDLNMNRCVVFVVLPGRLS